MTSNVTTVDAVDDAKAVPHYELDPTWPKELPRGWVLAQLGSVVIDPDDNVVILNRRNITEEEAQYSENAPPIIVFDKAGDVVSTWGDHDVLPLRMHGSFIDQGHNVWLTGMHDGMLQKYSWNGELLFQIGTRGNYDSSDNKVDGSPLNSSKTQCFKAAGIAVDPDNGDIYVADGYGNRRVVVFDKRGEFVRQWGRQASMAEAQAGEPGVFMKVVHGIALSNQGLLYVSDRQGERVQVFEKDGTFVRNIWIRTDSEPIPDARGRGSAWWVDFSPDSEQRYLYAMNGRNEQVHILDHKTGEMLTSFGRPGHMPGAFTHGHTLAVDSESSVYVAETNYGRRIQKFRLVEP